MSEEFRDGKIYVSVDPDIRDIAPKYLKNRAEDVNRIRALVEAEKFSEIESLAHRLKGTGGGYGFTTLTQIGLEMEQAARLKDGELITGLNQRLSDYLSKIEIMNPEDPLSPKRISKELPHEN